MGNPIASRAGDICPRCHMAVASDSQDCPNCGERGNSTRRFPIYIGIVGLLALMFVAFVMVRAIRREDAAAARIVNRQDAPSPGASQPDKPPPLNK